MSFRLPLAALLLALAAVDLSEPAQDLPLAITGAVVGIALLVSEALDAFWLERLAMRERALEMSNSGSHSR